MDIAILVVACVLGFGLAMVTRSLRGANLALPFNSDAPLSVATGKNMPFRLTTFGELRHDPTTYRPRALLGMILAVLMALIGKLVLNAGEDWTIMMVGLSVLAGVVSFAFCGWVNSMAVAVMTGVPVLLAVWLKDVADWLAWLGEVRVIGLLAGALAGLYAGVFLSLNYRSLLEKAKLELKEDETLEGKKLSRAGTLYRKVYVFLLRWLPLVILYQCVAYWWPDIELSRIAGLLGDGVLPNIGRYALLTIALSLGLNVVLFTIPLFREMMQHTNLSACADFGKSVDAYHKIAKEKGHEKAKDKVEDFLSKDGRWYMFQSEQMMPIFIVGLVLAANGFGQALEKALRSGLVPETAELGGWPPTVIAEVLSGATFCLQAMFLIAWVGSRPSDGKIDDAAHFNVLTYWRARREKGLTYNVREDDGADAVISVGDAAEEVKPSQIAQAGPGLPHVPRQPQEEPVAPPYRQPASVQPVRPMPQATPVTPVTPVHPVHAHPPSALPPTQVSPPRPLPTRVAPITGQPPPSRPQPGRAQPPRRPTDPRA